MFGRFKRKKVKEESNTSKKESTNAKTAVKKGEKESSIADKLPNELREFHLFISQFSAGDEELAEKIVGVLAEKPYLIYGSFGGARPSLFQILLTNERYKCLKLLLNKEELAAILQKHGLKFLLEDLSQVHEDLWTLAARVDDKNNNILHLLAIFHKKEEAKILFSLILEKWPKLLHMQNEKGNTPLHEAVSNDNSLIIKLIAEYDKNFKTVSIKNLEGKTALGMTGSRDGAKLELMTLDEDSKAFLFFSPDSQSLKLMAYSILEKLELELKDKRFALTLEFLYSLLLGQDLLAKAPLSLDLNRGYEFVFSEGHVLTKELLETLWSLPKENSSLELLSHQALGLLYRWPLKTLVLGLNSLYPHADKQQKLVINYLLWQLLVYQMLDGFKPEDELLQALDIFYGLNLHETQGLDFLVEGSHLGEDLNQKLKSLLELEQAYALKQMAFKEPQQAEKMTSFDGVVNDALEKNTKERIKEIALIAEELKRYSVSIHQGLSVTSLGDLTKGNSPLNLLSHYFTTKVLTQQKDNLENALKFLLELTEALYPQQDKKTDYYQIMMISGVIHCESVSRLWKLFPHLKLPDNLSDPQDNYKALRQSYRQCPAEIPYWGIELRNLELLKEACSGKILARKQGEILLPILEWKDRQRLKFFVYQTDIADFFNSYQPMGDEAHYHHSVQLRRLFLLPEGSPSLDLDQWLQGSGEEISSILSILEHLGREYLSKNEIPFVKFENFIYVPAELIGLLLTLAEREVEVLKLEASSHSNRQAKISRQDKTHLVELKDSVFHAKNSKQSLEDEAMSTWEDERFFFNLRRCLKKLIEVNNNHYASKALAPKLNLIFYLNQVDRLWQEVKSYLSQSEANASNLERRIRTHSETVFPKQEQGINPRARISFLDERSSSQEDYQRQRKLKENRKNLSLPRTRSQKFSPAFLHNGAGSPVKKSFSRTTSQSSLRSEDCISAADKDPSPRTPGSTRESPDEEREVLKLERPRGLSKLATQSLPTMERLELKEEKSKIQQDDENKSHSSRP